MRKIRIGSKVKSIGKKWLQKAQKLNRDFLRVTKGGADHMNSEVKDVLKKFNPRLSSVLKN